MAKTKKENKRTNIQYACTEQHLENTKRVARENEVTMSQWLRDANNKAIRAHDRRMGNR